MNFRTVISTFITMSCAICCNKKERHADNIAETKPRYTVEQSEIAAEIIKSNLTELLSSLFSQSIPSILMSTDGWNAIGEKVHVSKNEYSKLKVSIYEIRHTSMTINLRARVEFKAQSQTKKRIGIIAHFDSSWSEQGDGSFKILSIGPPEQLTVNESPKLWFTNETSRVVGNEPIFKNHLSKGLDHWLLRIESIHGIDAFINNGLTLGDFNGDGLDDLYVCQPGGLPNRLLINSANGALVNLNIPGSDYLDHTSSALFVDIDNDSDQDLCLATPSGIVLLENDRGNKLILRGTLQTDEVDCHSLTATDYDLDGNLDLFITFALGSISSENGLSFQFDDARDGGSNQLFKGNGKWSFSEVTALTGLSESNNRHSLAASWHDYDLDGDPDLYIANDYGFNQLFRNDIADNKRIFKEISEQVGVQDRGAGMSVSWGDYNRDGLPDVYVGNMYSNAGNRITKMSDYLPNSENDLKKIYRRFAKGNTLLVQNKKGDFKDFGPTVSMGRWAWSSIFADINNDGWEDLLVANGYISGPIQDDL